MLSCRLNWCAHFLSRTQTRKNDLNGRESSCLEAFQEERMEFSCNSICQARGFVIIIHTFAKIFSLEAHIFLSR